MTQATLNAKIIRFIAICSLSFLVSILALDQVSPSQPQLQGQAQSINQLFISPDGNDNNKGTLNQPFRTIQRAKREVRKFNKSMTANIVVNLKGGTYEVDNSLNENSDNQQSHNFKFNELDSGNNGFQVIYQSLPNERATVSGGKELKNWQLSDRTQNIYKSYFGKSIYPRQFFVNGERAVRARGEDYPTGFKRTDTGFDFTNASKTYSNLNRWQNRTDIEFAGTLTWAHFRCHASQISQKDITLDPNCFGNKGQSWLNGISWIENAYELLDQPGEWYFNRGDGYIYYKPKPTEDITKVKAVVATQEKLLDIQGSSNIQFKNLNFEYGTWFEPNTTDGYAVVFTGFRYKTVGNKSRATATPSVGNIQITKSKNISFFGNLFQHLGTIGIDLRQGAQNINITGNKFTDLSGAAVQIGNNLNSKPSSVDEVQNIIIKNNYITRVAQEFIDHAGINFYYAGNVNIDHNEITDIPYSGISLGNPTLNPCTPSPAKNNKIQNNFVHNSMNKLVDGGAIYVNSWHPNSSVEGNYLSETYSTVSLYFDDGSRGFTAQNNVMIPYDSNVPWTRSLSPTNFENNIQNNFYSQAKEANDKSKGDFDALRNTIIKCKVGLSSNQSITNYINNSKFEPKSIPTAAQNIISYAGLETNYKSVKNLQDNIHVNLAFNKNVLTSSESDKFRGNKERGVDGSITSSYGWSSASSDRSPWYQVDLGKAQVINEIQLFLNNHESENVDINLDKPETRKNFEIRGSNNANFSNSSLLYKQGSIPVPYRVNLSTILNQTQAFRYIRVVKTDNLPLTIFELKLFSNPPQSLTFSPVEISQGICSQEDSGFSGEAAQGMKVNCSFPIKSSPNQVLKAGYFEGNNKLSSNTCSISNNQLICKDLATGSSEFGTKSIFVESNNFTWYDRASLEVQPFLIGQGVCDRNSEFPAYPQNKSVAYLGQNVACKFPVKLGNNSISNLRAGYNTLQGFLASDCKLEGNKNILSCPKIIVAYNQLGRKYISIQNPKNYTWYNKSAITIRPIFEVSSGTCTSASGKDIARSGENVNCTFPLTGNPRGTPYILPIPNSAYPNNTKTLFAQFNEGKKPQVSDPCKISGDNLICNNLDTSNATSGYKGVDVVYFGSTSWRLVNILTIK